MRWRDGGPRGSGLGGEKAGEIGNRRQGDRHDHDQAGRHLKNKPKQNPKFHLPTNDTISPKQAYPPPTYLYRQSSILHESEHTIAILPGKWMGA